MTDERLLADEIRAAAAEFSRLAELAVRQGMRVDVRVLPVQIMGCRYEAPLLDVGVSRPV